MPYSTLYLCTRVKIHPNSCWQGWFCVLSTVWLANPDGTGYQLIFSHFSCFCSPYQIRKKRKEKAKSADTPYKAQLMFGRLTIIRRERSLSLSVGGGAMFTLTVGLHGTRDLPWQKWESASTPNPGTMNRFMFWCADLLNSLVSC